ncbi:MAG: SDR family oxidoreductase [Alphaproteobacteria bacterium]
MTRDRVETMANTSPGSLFVFGLGYSAQALGRDLQAKGWQVAGTSRSLEGCAYLASHGFNAFVFSHHTGLLPQARTALAAATHVLSSIPPDPSGDPVLNLTDKILMRLKKVQWIGYLSTTGVYGDWHGKEVTEQSECHPTSDRTRRRLAAEAAWRDLFYHHRLPVHLFRLAGIYGPGYSVFDDVRMGKAQRIDKPGHTFSRIHVDDITQILFASMQKPDPGALYNLCDDEPAEPATVVTEACALLGVEPPPLIPFAEAQLSDMGRSFWRDHKRVSNAKIKTDLGIRLLCPTYREGLRRILAAETLSNR